MKTYFLPLLAALLVLGACTDPIDVDAGFETAQPVVDAWLTDESRPQTINLNLTQDYFAQALPPALTGATVVVCQIEPGNECFSFVEVSPGVYTWTPARGETLGDVGTRFVLTVESNGRTYVSQSDMRRVPPIDSISFQFEEEQIGLDEGIYAQVYARDLAGTGDRYLIRSTINDTLLNRPDEINVAADAAFDGGTASDGIAFILPIRFGINKLTDDGDVVALVSGDRVEVEIWSITEQAFQFLTNAEEQILNADNGLFTVPVVSTRGNVTDLESGDEVLGMFSVSAVSAAAETVE